MVHTVVPVPGVVIRGVVASVPEDVVSNAESLRPLFGSATDKLVRSIGIESRSVASQGTTGLDLALDAARALFDEMDLDPSRIGAVICVTFTPESPLPGDAPKAQNLLGLPSSTLAFDVNMACAGFVYGLYLAGLISQSTDKPVLLLDYDVQTPFVDPVDKTTLPLMSDAGTATLVDQQSDVSKQSFFSFFTDGTGRNALHIPSRNSYPPAGVANINLRSAPLGKIHMDGFLVYKFVAQSVTSLIKFFLESVSDHPERVDNFVPHQANMYMVERLAASVGIRKSSVWKSAKIYGNPASASIPLTIALNGEARGGTSDRLLIAGFGAGLSAAVGRVFLDGAGPFRVISYKQGQE